MPRAAVALARPLIAIVAQIERPQLFGDNLALASLAAVLLVYVQGLVDPADWLGSFLIIFVMAIFVWNQFYKPSQIGPAIERATG